MNLNVDFINSRPNIKLKKSIVSRIKESLTQNFIASINVLIKRNKRSEWKSEINLVSYKGSILHTQSVSSQDTIAFEEAFENLQKKIVKMKNETSQRA